MSGNLSRTISHPLWEKERNLEILKDWRSLEKKGEDKIALKLAVKHNLTPSRLYQIKIRTEELENELQTS